MGRSQEEKDRRLAAHKAARKKLGPQTPRPKRKKKKTPKPRLGRPRHTGLKAIKRVQRSSRRPLSALDEIKKYAEQGELPHQFLLRVSRGEKIEWGTGRDKKTIIPSFEQRLEAAKNAAGFFAPKLAQIDINQALSEDDLLAIIASAAAAAGIGLSVSGTGKKKAGLSAPVGPGAGDGYSGVTVDQEGPPVP